MFSHYKKIVAIGALAFLFFVAIGFIIWNLKPSAWSLPTADLLPPLATTTFQSPPQAEESAEPSSFPPYRGEAVRILNPDPRFLGQVPEATYQKSLEELASLAGRIKQNPRDYESWLRVAHIKHFYGDEIGSRDAYEYMNLVLNEYPLPFYNLALLYGYYLKEPAKAVPKYQAAIERNPAETSYYIGFADFYREVLGDLKSAEAILLEGEKRAQDKVNIFIALGTFYKIKGDIVKSIAHYEKAIAFPSFQGQERDAVLSEVEKLRQSQNR